MLFVWVLHLVDDVTAVLRECVRALRDGGRVVACVGGRQDVDDEITRVVEPVNRLRHGDDRPEHVITLAGDAGLRLAADETTPDLAYTSSPSIEADRIEARTSSALWDLDDDTWQRVVAPVVDALRALPEPDRPRRRLARYRMLAFERA
jgi:SAM-dependent methyltransferase